jgi:hypothetical protein
MIKHFILAGNHQEAVRFAIDQSWQHDEVFIITPTDIPSGYHGFDVFCVGSYQSLPNLFFIESCLTAVNARYLELRGGLLWALQQPLRQKGGQQTQMPIKCRIWWDQALDCYVVSSGFSAKLVDSLKQFIPSGSRDFDPTTKFWSIKEQYGEFVRQVAESAFGVGSVAFTSKNVTQQSGPQAYQPGQNPYNPGQKMSPSSSGATTEDAIVAFFGLLTYDAAKRAYLVASATLHPDKPTGDGVKMTKLNELWTRIEKEFFKR